MGGNVKRMDRNLERRRKEFYDNERIEGWR